MSDFNGVGIFDARIWAKEFMKHWKEHSHDPIWIDEELMVGWFANAIMAGYDKAKNEEGSRCPKCKGTGKGFNNMEGNKSLACIACNGTGLKTPEHCEIEKLGEYNGDLEKIAKKINELVIAVNKLSGAK